MTFPQRDYVLFLDDERNPAFVLGQHEREAERLPLVVWCKDVTQAMSCVLLNGMPSWLYLDHDLGGPDEEDSMIFLRWLQENCGDMLPPKYVFLTANPVGRENMRSFLESWKKSLTL